MRSANNALLLLAQVTIALAWGGHYSNSDDDSGSSTSDDNDTSFGSSDFSFGFGRFSFGSQHKKLVAHAVLATFAFGFLFPAGGILIRLASFRGLWLVHGQCEEELLCSREQIGQRVVYANADQDYVSFLLTQCILQHLAWASMSVSPALATLCFMLTRADYTARTIESTGHTT